MVEETQSIHMSMDVTCHIRVNAIIQHRVNAVIGGEDTEQRCHVTHMNESCDTCE